MCLSFNMQDDLQGISTKPRKQNRYNTCLDLEGIQVEFSGGQFRFHTRKVFSKAKLVSKPCCPYASHLIFSRSPRKLPPSQSLIEVGSEIRKFRKFRNSQLFERLRSLLGRKTDALQDHFPKHISLGQCNPSSQFFRYLCSLFDVFGRCDSLHLGAGCPGPWVELVDEE